MTLQIPYPDHREMTILNVFFGSGENQKVEAQTINEISSGSGTYRLVPPSSYDRAFAFSTRDLFVINADTDAELYEVFTLEPLSGILTLLTSAPYPTQLIVTYRFYAAHAAIRVTKLKTIWPEPVNQPDAYAQG